MVSSISQRYPFTGRKAAPVGGGGFMKAPRLEPGQWRFERVEDIVGRRFDHLDPVCGAGVKNSAALAAHRTLWRRVRDRLATL
jgi:hypothetical protein